MNCLREQNIVIIGGDRREVELGRIWRLNGVTVNWVGFERCPQIPHPEEGVKVINSASVLIFPLSGVRDEGTVLATFAGDPLKIEPLIKMSGPQTLLLAGTVGSSILPLFAGHGKLVYTAQDEELSILNAIPTAEGAIQKAMELSEITIHGSRALVLGLGKCGRALAGALQGLGAQVTTLVRRYETKAEAITKGYKPIFWGQLAEEAARADFIFNTVPASLLTAPLLKKVNKETIILDLASSPGGTDFTYAAGLGLSAVLLPGLPGRVAPKSSGKILAGVYRKIINCNLG